MKTTSNLSFLCMSGAYAIIDGNGDVTCKPLKNTVSVSIVNGGTGTTACPECPTCPSIVQNQGLSFGFVIVMLTIIFFA